MEKIKRYFECHIPTKTCNLRCHYCYIALTKSFTGEIIKLRNPPEIIRKALSKERLGGVCYFNLCARGETLLSDDILPTVRAMIEEGHYVTIVTNGTLRKRFEEIASWPKELLGHLFLKISLHYFELKRIDGFDNFFGNIELIKNAGASFTVEVTPSDELIPHIDDLKELCMKRLGALCHVTIARDTRTDTLEVLTDHDFETYKTIWGTFQSELFDFKAKIFLKKREEFCYAGDWTLWLNLNSGTLKQCYKGERLGNIYENIDQPLEFKAIGHNCCQPHCYNGHVFLTFGAIPELDTPTHAQMRNRVCANGEEWLQPGMKEIMSQKLKDNNKQIPEN